MNEIEKIVYNISKQLNENILNLSKVLKKNRRIWISYNDKKNLPEYDFIVEIKLVKHREDDNYDR